MPAAFSSLEERRARLHDARLYLVVEAWPRRDPSELLAAALGGGVDIVQLRDKHAGDDQVVAAATTFRAICHEHGALFFVNDRPDLALRAGADGVHVGQEDASVEQARATAGGELLVGLSTHTPDQFDAGLACGADYLCAGPVFATPTKPGRPATGWGLVRHAAAVAAGTPWFAIGGIDAASVADAAAAGAGRAVVVRALRDARDPRAAAAELRRALAGSEVGLGAAQ